MDSLDNAPGFSVFTFKNPDELIPAAAAFIYNKAEETLRQKKYYSLVLSGGSTPEGLYRYLADRYSKTFPWDKTYFFWGDERCVAPEDSLSNYHMAYETMLGPAGVPEENILRIKGELGSIEGALEYEEQLQNFSSLPEEIPVFDTILLGMGSDGHTASLFPGRPELNEDRKPVIGVRAPEHIAPYIDRISMTLPVLNKATSVLFLIKGDSKAKILRQILTGDQVLPAAMASKSPGATWYISDNAI